jgi:hypothetical protein
MPTVRVSARLAQPMARVAGARPAPRARCWDVRSPSPAAPVTVPVTLETAVVRRAPATDVRLRAPLALRRVFARPLGLSFLSEDSPESRLLLLLSSATLRAAARAEQALQSTELGPEAARVVSTVGDLAFGRSPLDGFWGDRPCVDALRLRLARSDAGPEVRSRIGLEGFYVWAGPRLGAAEMDRLPGDLVPEAATAVAAVSGCRRAFELVAARAASPAAGREVLETGGRLALRCALGGLFSPSLVRFLLPSMEERLEPPSPEAWEKAMLALHAYRLAGHEAGTTHVAAAIVSTIVRDQIGRIGRRSLPSYRPREWGAPPPTREMDAEHRQVVALVGVLLTQLWWTYKRSWPEGWGAPDPVQVERRVSKALGESGGPAYDVFLDDSLAVAACHALLGHTPSALATLASSRTPDVFVPARDRLSRALERGAFDQSPAPVVGTALARDFQGRLDRLRNTPDPAEFGSPDWRHAEVRGRLLSRLQQERPRGLALALRTLVGKGFDELDRFWLAPIAPRRDSVLALAAWLDGQAPVIPSDRDFILFLDEQCQATHP